MYGGRKIQARSEPLDFIIKLFCCTCICPDMLLGIEILVWMRWLRGWYLTVGTRDRASYTKMRQLNLGKYALGHLDFEGKHKDASDQETASSKYLYREERVTRAFLDGSGNGRTERRRDIAHEENRKCRWEFVHLDNVCSDGRHHSEVGTAEETVDTWEGNQASKGVWKRPDQQVTTSTDEHGDYEHIQTSNVITNVSGLNGVLYVRNQSVWGCNKSNDQRWIYVPRGNTTDEVEPRNHSD